MSKKKENKSNSKSTTKATANCNDVEMNNNTSMDNSSMKNCSNCSSCNHNCH